jgi:hypothetical protein
MTFRSIGLGLALGLAFVQPVGSKSSNDKTPTKSFRVNSPIPVPVPPDSCVVINEDVKGCNEGGKFTVAGLNNVNDWSTFHKQHSNLPCYIIRDTKNNDLSAACHRDKEPSIYLNVKNGLWVKAEMVDAGSSTNTVRVKGVYNEAIEL